MRLSSTVSCLLLYLVHDVLAAKYSEYILAPKSRTIYPKSVHGSNGTVTGADSLIGSQTGSIVFQGKSSVTFDFGINIAGPASITTGNSTSSAIGLTYSESSLWINELASDAMADSGLDAIYWLDTTSGAGNHTIDKDHERGGFRYMTLVYNGTEALEVTGVIVNYAAMPHVEDMTDYTGYFHCNDDKINRVWYAGEKLSPLSVELRS